MTIGAFRQSGEVISPLRHVYNNWGNSSVKGLAGYPHLGDAGVGLHWPRPRKFFSTSVRMEQDPWQTVKSCPNRPTALPVNDRGRGDSTRMAMAVAQIGDVCRAAGRRGEQVESPLEAAQLPQLCVAALTSSVSSHSELIYGTRT